MYNGENGGGRSVVNRRNARSSVQGKQAHVDKGSLAENLLPF